MSSVRPWQLLKTKNIESGHYQRGKETEVTVKKDESVKHEQTENSGPSDIEVRWNQGSRSIMSRQRQIQVWLQRAVP